MKKYWIYYIIFLLLNFSCKKEKTNVIDFRDYYSGEFEFTLSIKESKFVGEYVHAPWQTNVYYEDFFNNSDTSNYNVMSGLVNSYEDSRLYIRYGSGIITPKIDLKNDTVIPFSKKFNKFAFSDTITYKDTIFYCNGNFLCEDTIIFKTYKQIISYDSITPITMINPLGNLENFRYLTITTTSIYENAIGYRKK